VVSQATTTNQQVVRAPIGEIAAAARAARVEPPSTLVVGDVVNVLGEVDAFATGEVALLAGAAVSPR
jgi:siroheme synthase